MNAIQVASKQKKMNLDGGGGAESVQAVLLIPYRNRGS